jgi:putative SOS response-associated peptidase YedK
MRELRRSPPSQSSGQPKARPCLIPVSGFYEWKRDVEPKQPYYIHRKDDDPIGFAGLWETWKQGDEELESCTIVSTDANEMMSALHNRMPVILDPQDYDWWMTGKTEEVGQLLKPCPSEWLEAYPVSRQVNSVRNKGPDLVERAA